MITNILTVDVEDYFHVSAFENRIPRSAWDGYPLRVRDNTFRILDLLDDARAKATFFILGWVARREPGLVREIADRGHDVACHGQAHRRVYDMSPDDFRKDLREGKMAIEDACGRRVEGYRAPSFSIRRSTFWYLDILCGEGFTYDSSIFPIRHDHYGIPDFPRFPMRMTAPSGGRIAEFPPSTVEFFGVHLPIGGGGFLRLLPLGAMRAGIRRINDREGKPAILYFHPWEIDPGQPRIHGISWKSALRHYLNLDRTEGKVRSLLSEFPFGSIRSGMTSIEGT